MKHRLNFDRLALALLACAACSSAAAQAVTPPTALTLYQRLDSGPHGDTLWLALKAGAWRVGTPDGPPATSAQLRAVLADLQAVGSGRGGAALAAPAFAGIAHAGVGPAALGWVAVPTAASDRQRWFGLIAPERYVGLAGVGWRLGLRYRDSAPRAGAWLVLQGAGAADTIATTDTRGLAALGDGARAR